MPKPCGVFMGINPSPPAHYYVCLIKCLPSLFSQIIPDEPFSSFSPNNITCSSAWKSGLTPHFRGFHDNSTHLSAVHVAFGHLPLLLGFGEGGSNDFICTRNFILIITQFYIFMQRRKICMKIPEVIAKVFTINFLRKGRLVKRKANLIS